MNMLDAHKLLPAITKASKNLNLRCISPHQTSRRRPEGVAQFSAYIGHAWGSGGSVPFFAPSLANRPGGQQW
jgi:hypothetical protein